MPGSATIGALNASIVPGTTLGMPVAASVSTSIDVAAATNAGTPIVTDQPQHGASSAIVRLASTLAGEPVSAPVSDDDAQQDEPAEKGRRMFRRKKEFSS